MSNYTSTDLPNNKLKGSVSKLKTTQVETKETTNFSVKKLI